MKAYDVTTGSLLWDRKPLGEMGDEVLAEGASIYAVEGSHVVARRLAGGRIRWRWLIPASRTNLQVDAATFYALFLRSDQGVVALNADNRSVRWSSPEKDVLAVGDGTAYLASNGGLVARDVGTGALLWQSGTAFDGAVAANGVVYGFDNATNRVVAMSAINGATLDAVPGEAAIVADGRLFVQNGRRITTYS